jgi:putative membrane protein
VTRRRRPFLELILASLASLALAIGSPYPEQMLLQHSATLLLAAYLGAQIWRHDISPGHLRCLLGFMLLHAFAARWIYSYVPYDSWSKSVFGFSITQTLHFRRNHFDRLVHFSYGLLVTPYMGAQFQKLVTKKNWATYSAVEFVAATSVLYELFEWGLTLVLSPDDIESYNGQQGDIWDAHKDMMCAIVGSCLVAAAILAARRRRRVEAS